MKSIPAELREVAEKVQKGGRPRATVRTVLRWFEAERRGFRIVREVRRALKRVKLTTVPDLEGAYIDSQVTFISKEEGEKKAQKASAEGNGKAIAVIETISTGTTTPPIPVDPTYRIGRLESANKSVVSVKPDETIQRAATLMLNHNFSQLPVMVNERDVKGIVTWRTVGKRFVLGTSCEAVREVMEPHQEISAEASLFSAIELIVQHDCVLVRDSEKKISGIVTTHDLGSQFGSLAEPFLLLGEIENHTRGILVPLSKAELAAAADPGDGEREIEDVADLTFGEYLRLLTDKKIWSKLGLKIDQKTFAHYLEEIRKIRNDVMHFDPEGIAPDDMKKLRSMVVFMRQLQTLGAN
jgi:CBS domain-containing protein